MGRKIRNTLIIYNCHAFLEKFILIKYRLIISFKPNLFLICTKHIFSGADKTEEGWVDLGKVALHCHKGQVRGWLKRRSSGEQLWSDWELLRGMTVPDTGMCESALSGWPKPEHKVSPTIKCPRPTSGRPWRNNLVGTSCGKWTYLGGCEIVFFILINGLMWDSVFSVQSDCSHECSRRLNG